MTSTGYKAILYFEAVHNYIYLHTEKHEYRERKTMKTLLKELPKDIFMQTSKSYVVNIAAVKEVEGDMMLLSNGQKIKIARSRLKNVKQEYIKHIVDFYDA